MKGGLFLSYNKNIITLVASMFLVASGYTMVIPFLPLYLGELGVPDHEIALWTGLVFSSCFLVAGIMGPIWGKLADLGGKKKMAVRAAVLLGFSYLFCGLCQNQYHLMAARAFQGFANGFVAASMAIISDSADSDKLGGTLGMAQTSLVVGGILGPLMGGALSHAFGMRNTFFLSALFLWIVAAAVIVFVKDRNTGTVHKTREKTSISQDLSYAAHNPSLRELLLLTFFLQTTLLMIQPVTSLYVGELMHHEGNIELTAGFIMSSGGLAGALTTTLWGKFGQSHGYYFFQLAPLRFSSPSQTPSGASVSANFWWAASLSVPILPLMQPWWSIRPLISEDAYSASPIRPSSLEICAVLFCPLSFPWPWASGKYTWLQD